MRDVDCLGIEINLLDCMYTAVTGPVYKRRDVGVACENNYVLGIHVM